MMARTANAMALEDFEVGAFASPEALPGPLSDAVRRFFAQSPTSSPYQDPAYCGADGPFPLGTTGRIVVVHSASRIVAAGIAREVPVLGRHIGGAPALIFHKGPVIAPDADIAKVLNAFSMYARQRGAASCEIQPQWTGEDADLLCAAARRAQFQVTDKPHMAGTLMIGLTRGSVSVFEAMHQGTRHKIRKAERLGIRAEPVMTASDVRAIHCALVASAERKGFTPATEEMLHAFARMCFSDTRRGCLLKAVHDGAVCGAIVVCRSGLTAEYLFGGAVRDPGQRSLPIAYGLHWRAIQWAAEANCKRYHMGGYDPQRGGGVARFKQGFGGEHVHFAPPLVHILRPALHGAGRMLARMRGRAP